MRTPPLPTLLFCLLSLALSAQATRLFTIGPGKDYTRITDFPWEDLVAGDVVEIHHNGSAYREKFNVAAIGTVAAPVTVRGVPDAAGNLPVITGENAVSRPQLDYWNQYRAPIRIGEALVPLHGQTPSYIVIENLEIRSARAPYTFTNTAGNTEAYHERTAGIYVEAGTYLTIRNCTIRDCGNGLFTSHNTYDVLVEGCRLFENGIVGSDRYHNAYTESHSITYQFNYIGPQRPDCRGNAVKDRSSGTVIRYNWVEGGAKQLDLVDSDYADIYTLASYDRTYVYGNVLIEAESDPGNKIVQYGGDSKVWERYRSGTLYFYHNTVISKRTGAAALFRLDGSSIQCLNNILYAPNGLVMMIGNDSTVTASGNWITSGTIADSAINQFGDFPGWRDFAAHELTLRADSPCLDAGDALPGAIPAAHRVQYEYRALAAANVRDDAGSPDLGAFAFYGVRTSQATDDVYAPIEDTRLYIPPALGLLANDRVDLDYPARPILLQAPAHGSVSLAGDGSFRYLPAANFAGTDSFDYGLVEPPPMLTRFHLSDSDALDTIYNAGDQLHIGLDQRTNQGAGTSLSKADIDGLFSFQTTAATNASLGAAYQGVWLDRSNVQITITDATGAAGIIPGQVHAVILPTASVRSENSASPAADGISPPLAGAFGGEIVQWQNVVNATLSPDQTLSKIAGSALWGSGASSQQQIHGNAVVEMLVDTVAEFKMFGISTEDHDASKTIDWAIMVQPQIQKILLYEGGYERKGTTTPAIVAGDRLRITISANRVSYSHNDALVYESLIEVEAADYPLLVDCSLGLPGTTLPPLFLVSEVPATEPAASEWQPTASDPIANSATVTLNLIGILDPPLVYGFSAGQIAIGGRAFTRSATVPVNIQADDPDSQVLAWLLSNDGASPALDDPRWGSTMPTDLTAPAEGLSEWHLWYQLSGGSIRRSAGMASVHWNSTQSFGTIRVSGVPLLFGTRDDADDGGDAYDITSEDLSYLVANSANRAERFLAADFRRTSTQWRIETSRRLHDLTWDLSNLVATGEIHLQPLLYERANGPVIDLRVESAAKAEADAFELVIGHPLNQQLNLNKGWNLVGCAVMNAQSQNGLAFRWRSGEFVREQYWPAEQGIWLYCDAPRSETLTGLVADGRVGLTQGWNLISPAASRPAIEGTWRWDGNRLVPVAAGTAITPGVGYWIFSNSPGEL